MAGAKSRDHASLGAALRELRLSRELTLEALGDSMDEPMNPRYISAVERGEVNISFANLLRLCAALGVRLSEVVERYEVGLKRKRRG